MRTLYKKIIAVCIFTFITTAVCAQTLDKIAAVVNDNVITENQLNQQIHLYSQQMQLAQTPLPANLRSNVLQQMIDTQLQIELAKKTGISVDDASVTQAITRIAAQNGLTLAQLQAKIAQQGMNYNNYRAEIKKQMLISDLQQREVAPRVIITEQAVTDFLRQHGNKLTAVQTNPNATAQPVLYHVRDILIPVPASATPQQAADALKQANSLLAKIKTGVNVDVQASDLGWRTLKDLPDIFAPIVKNMQPGTLSQPIKAENGYHIVQLLSVRGAAVNNNSAVALQSYTTHARHILIKTNPLTPDDEVKIRLVRIRDAILHGANFAQEAQENSQDPGSASKGGDLGWVNPGMLDPTFEKVMNGLKPGQISEPFKTAFGWHIVQVLERKNIAGSQSLLRNQARIILYQHKFGEALQNWLQQLRSQSYVKVMGA